jgi:hypothetical protein
MYCTLFDSNYADKGIVMLRSLRQHDNDSCICVLCMDELCYSIIERENLFKVIPISLNEFIDDDLKTIKPQRSKGEFCWSCTAKLIKYCIDTYDSDYCTYVDSDLFFYSDPRVLIKEMINANCVVQVVPHRFPQTRRWKTIEKTSGKNCVQFNTFSNHKKSIALLSEWIAQCIEKCDRHTGGDQLYTSNWGDFNYVNVSDNDGAGLAPWNIENYKLLNTSGFKIIKKEDRSVYDMVFYHFQGLEYIERYIVNTHIRNKFTIVDQTLIDRLYIDYLIKIEQVKQMLESRFGVAPMYSHITGLFENEISDSSLKSRVSAFLEGFNTSKDTYYIRKYVNNDGGNANEQY